MRMTEKEPNVLYVRMLGGFSIRWNSSLIAGGSKASDSQFTYLLQILIVRRPRHEQRAPRAAERDLQHKEKTGKGRAAAGQLYYSA